MGFCFQQLLPGAPAELISVKYLQCLALFNIFTPQ